MVAGGPSVSERPSETRWPDFPTASAVAEGIHGVWYLIRDPAGVGHPGTSVFRWSLASLGPPDRVGGGIHRPRLPLTPPYVRVRIRRFSERVADAAIDRGG